MTENTEMLNDVVVIGYGVQKKVKPDRSCICRKRR